MISENKLLPTATATATATATTFAFTLSAFTFWLSPLTFYLSPSFPFPFQKLSLQTVNLINNGRI